MEAHQDTLQTQLIKSWESGLPSNDVARSRRKLGRRRVSFPAWNTWRDYSLFDVNAGQHRQTGRFRSEQIPRLRPPLAATQVASMC